MQPEGTSSLIRKLLIPVFLSVAVLSCVGVGLVVFTGSARNNLNPLESFVLRLTLSTRGKDLETPLGSDPTAIRFIIAKGDTASVIGKNLLDEGFIKDADLFRNYVRYYGLDSQLQAGTYFLRKTYTIPQIALALTNAGASSVTIQVIEGWRVEEIAAAIDANPMLTFKGADFLKLVGPGAFVAPDIVKRLGLPVGVSLEGLLFPDTYVIPPDATAADLVARMVAQFNLKITDQMISDAKSKGLTIYQVAVVASIVQREGFHDEELPLIASVYLNRFRLPMTLDADPTVQYALGNKRDPSTWWPQITQADYRGVISPFNTYLNVGLPPTPIAASGIASIQAVIYAPTTPYLFFRGTCNGDGHLKFATTFAEHQANACN